jgi:hypothetical protein
MGWIDGRTDGRISSNARTRAVLGRQGDETTHGQSINGPMNIGSSDKMTSVGCDLVKKNQYIDYGCQIIYIIILFYEQIIWHIE